MHIPMPTSAPEVTSMNHVEKRRPLFCLCADLKITHQISKHRKTTFVVVTRKFTSPVNIALQAAKFVKLKGTKTIIAKKAHATQVSGG